jgi:hypothetical protein
LLPLVLLRLSALFEHFQIRDVTTASAGDLASSQIFVADYGETSDFEAVSKLMRN